LATSIARMTSGHTQLTLSLTNIKTILLQIDP
jgi:hypothetical protein